MSIAILCSGGDAPGMNAAIKKFVEYLLSRGETPFFIYDGLEGLIDGRVAKASYEDVSGIIHRGGTIIGSSRSKRFFERKYREIAYKNLAKNGIRGVVALGGDGTFKAMNVFKKEFNVSFVGVPSTIDNDIHGTDLTIGSDTALNVIRDAIDKIRDTASSFKRAFVVEVMGRECGYLAAVSALTSGAEIAVIPEMEFDKKGLFSRLENEVIRGRRYILAVVCEGTKMSQKLSKAIERELGIESRVTVLGHIQRGGSPSVTDRLLAFEFIVNGVDKLLKENKVCAVTTIRDGKFGFKDIGEVVGKKYEIDPAILKMLNRV